MTVKSVCPSIPDDRELRLAVILGIPHDDGISRCDLLDLISEMFILRGLTSDVRRHFGATERSMPIPTLTNYARFIADIGVDEVAALFEPELSPVA